MKIFGKPDTSRIFGSPERTQGDVSVELDNAAEAAAIGAKILIGLLAVHPDCQGEEHFETMRDEVIAALEGFEFNTAKEWMKKHG